MAKTKTVFFCTNCGNETPKWQGRCPSCGAWNTMQEHVEKPIAVGKAKSAPVGVSRMPKPISQVDTGDEIRFFTGMGELDRVLGGGAVAGSLVLVGGAPPPFSCECVSYCDFNSARLALTVLIVESSVSIVVVILSYAVCLT